MQQTEKLAVSFKHPIDSAVRTANIGADATPRFIVDQLVKANFMPAAAAGQPYSLITPEGKRLDPDTSLGAANVAEGTQLAVVQDHQGASC